MPAADLLDSRKPIARAAGKKTASHYRFADVEGLNRWSVEAERKKTLRTCRNPKWSFILRSASVKDKQA